MFERFTGEARAAVVRAVEEAQRRDSPAVGAEHLLLALGGDPRTAAALAGTGVDAAGVEQILEEVARTARRGGLDEADTEALASLGIDVDAIVAGVEREHGEGALVPPARRPLAVRLLARRPADARPSGHRPFTPAAKKVLERALRACVEDDRRRLTVDHVLLGVAGGDDVVGRALTARGAGPDRLRSWFAAHPA